MGQKYRADYSEPQKDGAKLWFTKWMGGPTLAKIENCQLPDIEGDMRRTVVITGEPDTYFSIPAETRISSCHVRGYVTTADDGNLVFHQCYY